MKKLLSLVVCAIVLSGGVSDVCAKDHRVEFGKRPSMEEIKKHEEMFAEKLGLSKEQREKAEVLRKNGRKKMEPLMKQQRELHKKMEKLRRENMDEFEKILTNAQKEKLKEMKKEHAGKHFGKFHHKGKKDKHVK